jgi:hypothetical protein
MTEQAKIDDKVQKPAAHFDQPHEVVTDSSLSKCQKVKALDTLEQDARQLSEASTEGMAGGERSKLPEVLEAKSRPTLHLKHATTR